MVDYQSKIKIGVYAVVSLAVLAILAVVLVPLIFPGTAKPAADATSTDAVYELVWNGTTNDHVVIEDFTAYMAATKEPILIDFWAEWCGPCRAAAPTIEKLAETYAGKAHVVKINTDLAGEIAQAFGVTGIPNFVIVQDSAVVNSLTGFGDGVEQSLSDMLDSVM
ncbi:MAG: thioredoxin domain-containing protein [Eubacteriales bacterium]|nr:thioredoxin domain-containing protein [Eubacteriales bacterium]